MLLIGETFFFLVCLLCLFLRRMKKAESARNSKRNLSIHFQISSSCALLLRLLRFLPLLMLLLLLLFWLCIRFQALHIIGPCDARNTDEISWTQSGKR